MNHTPTIRATLTVAAIALVAGCAGVTPPAEQGSEPTPTATAGSGQASGPALDGLRSAPPGAPAPVPQLGDGETWTEPDPEDPWPAATSTPNPDAPLSVDRVEGVIYSNGIPVDGTPALPRTGEPPRPTGIVREAYRGELAHRPDEARLMPPPVVDPDLIELLPPAEVALAYLHDYITRPLEDDESFLDPRHRACRWSTDEHCDVLVDEGDIPGVVHSQNRRVDDLKEAGFRQHIVGVYLCEDTYIPTGPDEVFWACFETLVRTGPDSGEDIMYDQLELAWVEVAYIDGAWRVDYSEAVGSWPVEWQAWWRGDN